jgi:toxin ParE1/3/4
MPQASISISAEADLAEIWTYIARDNPDLFIDSIYWLYRKERASNPHLGRVREELSQGLRSLVFERYVIFYHPLPDGAEVIRVLHGMRDIENIFDS